MDKHRGDRAELQIAGARRHDAYYMGTDGTGMQAAYVSTAPVRSIMEFDNVGEQFNSVALVSGSEQIKNVPISASGAKAQ
jgi:hypothetical protein